MSPPAAAATPANTAIPAATPQNGAQSNAPAATSAEAAAAAHEFEVKIDGELRKFTRTEAERALSKSGYAEKVVQQAREQLKKLAEEREQRKLEDDAWSDEAKLEELLSKKGVDLDKLARRRLQQRVTEQEMTPEQREALKEKARADDAEKKLSAIEAEKKKARQAEATKVLQARLEGALVEAAERAGVPKGDPDAFFSIYETVKEWARLGLPFDADRIVESAQERVTASYDSLRKRHSKGLKGKALAEALGDDIVNEMIRYRTELLRGGGVRPQPTQMTQAPKKQDSPYITRHELEEKYRGGIR